MHRVQVSFISRHPLYPCITNFLSFCLLDNRQIDRPIPQAHLSPRPPSVPHEHYSMKSSSNTSNIEASSAPNEILSLKFSAGKLPAENFMTNKDLLALHNNQQGKFNSKLHLTTDPQQYRRQNLLLLYCAIKKNVAAGTFNDCLYCQYHRL